MKNTSNKTQEDLSQAFHKHEFLLYYQPQWDIKEKKIKGVEALIRWNHPRQGIINPAPYFEHAQEESWIVPLGEWILEESCRTNKLWQTQGYQPIAMSVNLFPQHFYHPHLFKWIEQVLERTQLDPHYLDLEITELTIMDDIPRINKILNRIKGKGIRIAIDDFGTGYTSIRYLKDFPINILKIDQSFIQVLPQDQRYAEVVTHIIGVAHQFDIIVIAEGIETWPQLEFLIQQQCDMAQGYFISEPLPADQVVSLLNPQFENS